MKGEGGEEGEGGRGRDGEREGGGRGRREKGGEIKCKKQKTVNIIHLLPIILHTSTPLTSVE